jgi:DNA-binding LacI/PurR family transcriptional regulator
MGRIATEMLLDMIERGTPHPDVADVIVEPRLVVRQSTGPLPG